MALIPRRQFMTGAGVLLVTSACSSGSYSAPPDIPTSPAPGTAPAEHTGVTELVETYGDQDLQRGEWSVPPGHGALPTVMLIHGGFWLPQYDRHLEDEVAADLVGRGYLVWNIDYRPSTTAWPTTLTDVALAYDHLSKSQFADRVDRTRLAVVGHSAGGQLALWLAGRHTLSTGTPGSDPPSSSPTLAVSQAGVNALTVAAETNLGDGAAQALCDGTPQQVPANYLDADPIDHVPTGVRTVLIHGNQDDIVPLSQSTLYQQAAVKAGDNCTLDRVPGNHFVNLEPDTEAVAKLRQALASM